MFKAEDSPTVANNTVSLNKGSMAKDRQTAADNTVNLQRKVEGKRSSNSGRQHNKSLVKRSRQRIVQQLQKTQ